MKKKFLSILFALVLALSLCLVTAVPVAAATHTVNPGENIQAAIDAADPGDIISVAAGTYTEQLVIDVEGLTLQSDAGAATTIIDGGGMMGPGVHITAANVTFQGFTVTDFTCTPYILPDYGGAGMGAIWVSLGDGAIISDNIIYNIRSTVSPDDYPVMWPAGIGIDVAASGVEVTGNLVHDVDSIGIRVRSDYEEAWPGSLTMTGILVEDNTVYNTANTGVLVAGNVTYVTIKGNAIYDSLEPNPYSLWILGNPTLGVPSDVTVEGNTISGGYVNVRVFGAENVNILGNTITDFVKGGIVVKDTLSVQIEGNIISTTSVIEASNGIQIGYIDAQGTLDLTQTTGTIKDNQVSGCHWEGYDPLTETYEEDWTSAGILVIAPNSALEILGNELYNNDVGLDIETGPATFMENNDVHDNSYGFVSWNAAPTINFNNIYPNALAGVYRAADGSLEGILDATENWWGDATGPTHADNPTGTGDVVSDGVLYAPWLESLSDLTVTTDVCDPPTTSIVVPGIVTATVPFDVSGTTTNPSEAENGKDFAHVLFTITLSGPRDFTVTELPSDIFSFVLNPEGIEGTFHLDNGDFVGFWGPPEGFAMPAPYDVTSPFTVVMTGAAPVGSYTVLVQLVDLDDEDYVVADATADFTLCPLIGIELLPTSIQFGDILPGRSSDSQLLDITNIGTVDVGVTAETESVFYNATLTIDTSALGDLSSWSTVITVGETPYEASLVVTVPLGWDVGTETGTIVFWVEAQ